MKIKLAICLSLLFGFTTSGFAKELVCKDSDVPADSIVDTLHLAPLDSGLYELYLFHPGGRGYGGDYPEEKTVIATDLQCYFSKDFSPNGTPKLVSCNGTTNYAFFKTAWALEVSLQRDWKSTEFKMIEETIEVVRVEGYVEGLEPGAHELAMINRVFSALDCQER
ncbi:MAG: hypothetical protein AB7F43_10100 [Bacteriovoracia bacterium]